LKLLRGKKSLNWNGQIMVLKRISEHVADMLEDYVEKNVEGIIQCEGVGLLLLLNMDVYQYVQIVYGPWECMGKRFSKVEEKSLEHADLLLKGYNPRWAL